MNTVKKNLILVCIVLFIVSCAPSKDNKNSYVLIKTSLGDITLYLYDETPGHRDNFIKLVKGGIYDGVSFHRVIKDFMIQTGDPETKTDYIKGATDSLNSYTIPAEINAMFFHKKGALAAAREGNDVNPEMRSSGSQFYIVQGVKYSDDELNQVEQRINNNIKQSMFVNMIKEVSDSNRISGTNLNEAEINEKVSLRMFEAMEVKGEYRIPEEQRNTYESLGGTPRLDGTYTVFGEVVSGLDVVDKIADAKTNEDDKPITDIRIIKMKLVRK
jgi:peptidyl-prolyl cis-trans isomerase B (cyclophilin B)